MIRWTYAVPRLAIVGTIVLVYWFAIDPLIQFGLVWSGQAAVGAKVEVDAVTSSLLHTKLRIDGIRVAEADHPMRNLFEMGDVTLDVETRPLLCKKLVVRDGSIRGLRFGTPRETSGALPGAPVDPDRSDGGLVDWERLGEQGTDRLETLGTDMLSDLEKSLESPPLLRELSQRWPAEYGQLRGETDQLHQRLTNLRQRVRQLRSAQPDPLRIAQQSRQLYEEFQGIEREVRVLHRRVGNLAERMVVDRRAVEIAYNHDREKIRQQLDLDRLDPQALSEYLLGESMSRQVRSVFEWIAWARERLPRKVDTPKPERGRGIDIPFGRENELPDVLIRRLVLSGDGTAGGEPFAFLATVAGITSDPGRYGQPATMLAQTRGAVEMSMKLILDDTGRTSRDRLVVECPALRQPDLLLGKADRLAVSVPGGTAEVSARIDLVGDVLSGNVTYRRVGVRLSPSVGQDYGAVYLRDGLTQALGEVEELGAVVHFSGTLLKPRFKLQSDLGEKLAGSLNAAFRQEIDRNRQELAIRLDTQIRTELAKLDQRVGQHRDALSQKLGLSSETLKQLQQELASNVPLPSNVSEELLGTQSPLGRLLR